MRLTPLDIARIRKLRYRDGLMQREVAEIIGCDVKTVWRYAPGHIGKIPNDKVRAAFEASRLTAAQVARRMGWMCAPGKADGARVKRALGILPDSYGPGIRSTRRLIDAETAGLLAEAIGVMAWEVMPDDEQEAA